MAIAKAVARARRSIRGIESYEVWESSENFVTIRAWNGEGDYGFFIEEW